MTHYKNREGRKNPSLLFFLIQSPVAKKRRPRAHALGFRIRGYQGM